MNILIFSFRVTNHRKELTKQWIFQNLFFAFFNLKYSFISSIPRTLSRVSVRLRPKISNNSERQIKLKNGEERDVGNKKLSSKYFNRKIPNQSILSAFYIFKDFQNIQNNTNTDETSRDVYFHFSIRLIFLTGGVVLLLRPSDISGFIISVKLHIFRHFRRIGLSIWIRLNYRNYEEEKFPIDTRAHRKVKVHLVCYN